MAKLHYSQIFSNSYLGHANSDNVDLPGRSHFDNCARCPAEDYFYVRITTIYSSATEIKENIQKFS